MKRWLLILALSSPLWGQSLTANYPGIPVVQAKAVSSNAASLSVTTRMNVTSGNLLIASFDWFGSPGATLSVSDSRCTSWTQLYTNTSLSVNVAVYGCFANSSGAETVTAGATGGSFMNLLVAEFPPYWTLTVDASAAASYTGTSPFSTPSITTTVNSDLLLAFVNGFSSIAYDYIASSTWGPLSFANGADSIAGAFSVSGAPGSYSASFSKNANGDPRTNVTLALKPNALAITSDATAPDGALTNVYDWCVQSAGGAAAITYSITGGSLQTGLSLNGSTGCITGTPTVSSTNSITFHVTDGTNTANKTISLKVGGSLNSISLTQSAVVPNDNTTSLAYGSNVTAGNMLVVSEGWEPSGFYLVNACTDTIGTPFRRIAQVCPGDATSGSVQGLCIELLAGVAPSSGADTVTCGTSMEAISEWANVGYVGADNAGTTTGNNASPATVTSNSLSTLVPNELLYAVGQAYSANSRMVPQSPFTDLNPSAPLETHSSYQIVTTVTGYTVSYAMTNNASGYWDIVLAGFRPSAGAVTAAATQIGVFLAGP